MSWKNARLTPGGSAGLNALGTQPWGPASGVEESQGSLYPPGVQDFLQVPQAMGVNLQGFVNPYSLTFYNYPVGTVNPTRVAPANSRRVYLILQNQGPGNIWFNTGQDVTLATADTNSNGFQLIETQAYEFIGGGGVDSSGASYTACFVPPDYISVITDTPGTTLLIGEGVWRYVTVEGQSL